MTWLIAGWISLRLRTSEHELRLINATLEERVREQVTALERAGRLRRYLSPQVASRLLVADVDPVAVRERREITVLFADLKGFTPMVERLPPDVLAQVLARYFDEVAEIVFAHGGTIDKFIGDAVMAFFGAPEPGQPAEEAVKCVRAALAVQARIAALGEEFVRAGAEQPLSVRIGIGSGLATVGEFGARHRTDYTVVGPPVNRAARLEPLAPAGGVLIDEETARLLGARGRLDAAGEKQLKGFSKPQVTFFVTAVDD